MPTIFVNSSRRDDVERLLRMLPGILSGRLPDVGGLANGFRVRCAFMFFSQVKEAFITKSRGGTDDAGIKWPELSREYLAYKRPMSGRRPPLAGGVAPGRRRDGSQPDGFMNARQLAAWRKDYSQALAWLAAQLDVGQAKAQAARIAWQAAKERGVKTKLEVFGSRSVEILRDRGILFNSLSPGTLTEGSVDANYTPRENQVFGNGSNWLLVGTNVEYAYYHQVSPGLRPIWPKDGNLPEVWMDEILEVGISGLTQIGEIVNGGYSW